MRIPGAAGVGRRDHDGPFRHPARPPFETTRVRRTLKKSTPRSGPECTNARLAKVATVERCHQSIAIRPACAGVVAILGTTLHLGTRGPGAGFRVIRVADPLCTIRDEGRRGQVAYLPAGLEAAARLLLERDGYEVIATGTTPAPLPAPDLASLRTFGTIDRPLLDFVRHHDRGLIRLGPKVDPTRLIAGVARAYPDATIAVAAARVEDVHRAARGLERHLPRVGRVAADTSPVEPARVVVGTYLGLGDPAVRIEHRDVLFALDVGEATGHTPRLVIHHASRARTYGLLAHDRQLAPRDRDRIAATFGLDALAIPRHGDRERTVEVITARIIGGPSVTMDLDVAALKREGLWSHPVRNRRVARMVAKVVRGGEHRPGATTSSSTFLEDISATFLESIGHAPRVAVLVEVVEHALTLSELLPGWVLITGSDVHAGGLSKKQVRMLSEGLPTTPTTSAPMIVTLAALDAVDLGSIDVLVRADGGVGIPPALASIPVPADAPTRPLLLIDCDDRHHPELRRHGRSRRAAYAELGWAVDGQPAPTPLERFLATRPRRPR